MTAKEKAAELVAKFGNMLASEHNFRAIAASKKCAIITVDEIIMQIDNMNDPEYVYFFPLKDSEEGLDGYEMIEFYKEVKKEIQNL